MNERKLESLGRCAAELDLADHIVDSQGNILDEETLDEQLSDQIRCALATETSSVQDKIRALEMLGGTANTFVGARSGAIGRRLYVRFPEIAVWVDANREYYGCNLNAAIEAYQRRVFESAREEDAREKQFASQRVS